MAKSKSKEQKRLQSVLNESVKLARTNQQGSVANYIPELASVAPDLTAIAVTLKDGAVLQSGDVEEKFTLQSTSKLVVLIGLLEELGLDGVMEWTRFEPSGDDFASIARLDQFGPKPSNPMLNSGAIALTGHIPGKNEERLAWLEMWVEKLFGTKLGLNMTVFTSERRTGDRNRALAYLLKSRNMISGDVDEVLESYFAMCSYEASVAEASYLPMLLANHGVDPTGNRIFSAETAGIATSIISTCGLYNETGTHMVRTGLPAKSGVSGFILAVALRQGGIATVSPRVNVKGTSLRGEMMLEHVSKSMGWHFADF